jgi:hypothetical protein
MRPWCGGRRTRGRAAEGARREGAEAMRRGGRPSRSALRCLAWLRGETGKQGSLRFTTPLLLYATAPPATHSRQVVVAP